MSCPPSLLLATYLVYFGLATTASVPLFAAVDWLHEGERFGVAQMVLAGGIPFRDVSIPHGLFPEVIRPLVAFRVLGESILADRIAGLVVAPLAYVAGVFYLWQLFRAKWWRVVALITFALYPLLLEPRHILVFFALALLTAGIRDDDHRRMFWGGVVSGLGFVLSTFDQAVFLLAMVLSVGGVLLVNVLPVDPTARALEGRNPGRLCANARAGMGMIGGLCIGLIPFFSYLGAHGLFRDFLEDLRRRTEWEKFVAPLVWPGQAFPSLPSGGPEMTIWYVIPVFYVAVLAWLIVKRQRVDAIGTRVLWPTMMFGVVSFSYAIRQYGYWKLAVVSFPFVVGVVYVLSLYGQEHRSKESPGIEALLLSCSLLLASAILVGSFLREWTPRQIWPRFVFPALAVGVGVVSLLAISSKTLGATFRRRLVMLCPLGALVVGVWFFHNAKPQLLHVLLKKPQIIQDVMVASSGWLRTPSGFSREVPPMLEDGTLSYLKLAAQEARPVVILAVGAGVYYFQAAVRPPSRYPHIEQAMSEASVREIIDGLDRTRAELLMACGDDGQRVTGWPIHPILRDYVVSHYTDSGRRLGSLALGEGCLFSVWTQRATSQGMT